jgi:hypothetical protein
LSRLPQPGERARILRSEVMDRIGATGKTGVVLDPRGSMMIPVKLDDSSGIRWNPANMPGASDVVFCTISEVELAEGRTA